MILFFPLRAFSQPSSMLLWRSSDFYVQLPLRPAPAPLFAAPAKKKRALPKTRPARLDAEGFLNAFDSNRDLICAAAAKVYVRGSKGSYDLVAADF
jgi:hypothetical protein